ncbi:hypothetical protein ANCCAN_12444 [Ancylostoma caninum]|uniref:Receptor expression-enhancing protein n=1 Tax=Ancylostoma caninum TaxID=29170 RepID=A0A368GF07_ANCCA|nr:hypothetical protein ANCCAN_12444 [Ancylostoma caninum]
MTSHPVPASLTVTVELQPGIGMATQLQQAYDVIQKKLQPVTDQMYDKDKNKTVEKILAAAEEKTKIKREKLVYGVVAGLLIYFIIGALAQILSNIIGFAYPAYRSIKVRNLMSMLF